MGILRIPKPLLRSRGWIKGIVLIFKKKFLCLKKRLSSLENTQAAVIELTDETDLDRLIGEYEDFLVEQTSVLRSAKAVLKRLMTKNHDTVNPVSATGQASANDRLPKIVIPKFNGDPTKWPSFWDQFTALIVKSTRSAIEKFVYLSSFLEDEAAAVIDGMAMTDANYKNIFLHIQA